MGYLDLLLWGLAEVVVVKVFGTPFYGFRPHGMSIDCVTVFLWDYCILTFCIWDNSILVMLCLWWSYENILFYQEYVSISSNRFTFKTWGVTVMVPCTKFWNSMALILPLRPWKILSVEFLNKPFPCDNNTKSYQLYLGLPPLKGFTS